MFHNNGLWFFLLLWKSQMYNDCIKEMFISSVKKKNESELFTAAISDWSICVAWVGGGDMFMCFLEGPTSQPTRLAYAPCWRNIVLIPLKRASQQERSIFITSWCTHVQSTYVTGTHSWNITFLLSNIVGLLLSWPRSDAQRKNGLLLLLLAFSSWRVNR